MPLPRLYIVRHGNTDWAEAHRFTGRTDLPLNARGEDNARRLAARLAGLTFSRVFTSPLQRARRTCELAGFGPAAQVDPDLIEWNYGDIDGHFSAEVYGARPDWDLFRDGAPNGESPQDVASRADRFIAKVRQTTGDVIAFSSGHISRMVAARWLALPPDAAGKLLCATASIGILTYEHTLQRPAIELWNDDGALPS
ncbi:MAG TPA: histidine phosphatase family protein [Tepidisphaeraceae bacterium]|nr:histidine phosphatase family protein [Tepidisphaeraceae bacterium]